MAKTKAEAKGKVTGSTVALIASSVLVVALTGLIFWLKDRQEKKGAELATAIKQYDQMKVMKRKLVEFKIRDIKSVVRQEKPDDLTAYIGKTATKTGLPQTMINQIAYEGEKNTPPWKEYPIGVTLSGLKDQPVPHGAFVSFLETIEKERPYLKTKNLTLSFAPASADYARVNATISWFRRD